MGNSAGSIRGLGIFVEFPLASATAGTKFSAAQRARRATQPSFPKPPRRASGPGARGFRPSGFSRSGAPAVHCVPQLLSYRRILWRLFVLVGCGLWAETPRKQGKPGESRRLRRKSPAKAVKILRHTQRPHTPVAMKIGPDPPKNSPDPLKIQPQIRRTFRQIG